VVTAIIPARGNSKGITRKNMFPLGGRPLIDWTIKCAQNANIDRVVVSTEDYEIGQHCADLGCVVVKRPVALSADNVHAIYVVLHAIEYLELDRQELVLMLLPTSPLRVPSDVNTTIQLLARHPSPASVIGVECVGHELNLVRMKRGSLHRVFDVTDANNKQRQNASPVYKTNGAIFAAHCHTLLSNKSFYTTFSIPYLMPACRSVEVDTIDDLRLAEALL